MPETVFTSFQNGSDVNTVKPGACKAVWQWSRWWWWWCERCKGAQRWRNLGWFTFTSFMCTYKIALALNPHSSVTTSFWGFTRDELPYLYNSTNLNIKKTNCLPQHTTDCILFFLVYLHSSHFPPSSCNHSLTFSLNAESTSVFSFSSHH